MRALLPRLAVQRALATLTLPGVSVSWLHRVERTPAGGYRVVLRLTPGARPSLVQAAAEQLAVALGVDTVQFRRVAPRLLLLTARPALPVALPPYPPLPELGEVPRQTPGTVALGVDGDGEPAALTLFDEAGGTVTLLAGSPGTGKSSALRLLVAGLLDTRTAVLWLDPKGGADAVTFARRVEAVPDASLAPVALEQLRAVNRLATRRAQALAAGDDLRGVVRLVVIVDEWAALGADGTKTERAELEVELRRLAATGRASQVALVLATQRPTATSIDVSTRGLAGTRLVFAVGDQHASVAALGQPGAEELDPKADRGTALLNDEQRVRPVRLYAVPADLRERAAAVPGFRRTVSELAAFEDACLPRPVGL